MTTSNSVNYSQTRTEVITDAFQLLGVYGLGRTVSAEDMAVANSFLNKMIKSWQSRGLHLWSTEEAYMFVTPDADSYTLSSDSSSAYACARSDAVLTTLGSAALSSATTLTVVTTTGMTAADIIGVVLTDGTLHWTTIVSVDSSTGLTITSGLASAAASGNNVYTFTSRINKPLRIHSVRRVSGVTSPSASNLEALSHSDYFSLPNKKLTGSASAYYYNPDLTTGKLYLWPCPSSASTYVEFTYERMLEDMDSASDTFDFPSEWLEVITWQLAVRLAPAFGKDEKAASTIGPVASAMYDELLAWDSQITRVSLSPGRK